MTGPEFVVFSFLPLPSPPPPLPQQPAQKKKFSVEMPRHKSLYGSFHVSPPSKRPFEYYEMEAAKKESDSKKGGGGRSFLKRR